jgi:hypothetical protein
LRTEVPQEIADQVIFESDRTCCVCRTWGRPIQLHHIDENPSNHDPANLAVLCFDCHRDTQITGGFDRKLSAGQVRHYREDWLTRVENKREARDGPKHSPAERLGVDARTTGAVEEQAARIAIGTPGFLDYVRNLPDIHRRAYTEAHLLWDTGITSEMRQGSYHVIEVLKGILLELARCYPPNHFGPDTSVYFDEYVKSRFSWAYKKLAPNGSGTGGTIVLVQAGGEVMNDLEEMIAGMVRSLTSGRDDFNYNVWLEEWGKA